MLLPEKHVSLAESILGLGSVVLSSLQGPRSVDQIYQHVLAARADGKLAGYHDFDSVVLAIIFLHAVGAVDANSSGVVTRCAS